MGMVAPQIKGKNRVKHRSQSNWCSHVSALSCRAYWGDDNVSPGDAGRQSPISFPLRHTQTQQLRLLDKFFDIGLET